MTMTLPRARWSTSLALTFVSHIYGFIGGGPLWGQAVWTGSGNVLSTGTGNSVGIGTTNPQSILDVASGGVAVRGTSYTSGGAALELNMISGLGQGLGQVSAVTGSTRTLIPLGIWGNPTTFYATGGIGAPIMSLTNSGNVGIGTVSPQYPLSVNGIVQAKEVLVNTGWSDYVFDPNYRLTPLAEVASYVQANHHLPEIPSADEVAEKGINLGEMQSKLLAKIEELTLHMIQAERENRELKERLVRLEEKR